MEPLATLPVFLHLHGRRVVLAGGDPAAAWKAELLSAAGANVEVYDPRPCRRLMDLASRGRNEGFGTIDIHHRAWRPQDIAGAAIAVGSITDEDDVCRFAGAARAVGVPVNIVDRPQYCDFQLGAIVNRSPLVIGISTDGAAPILGQTIRSEIETLLPAGIRRWAEAAKRWRARLRHDGLDAAGRRSFWRRFADLARREPERAPGEGDFASLLAASSDPADASVGRLGRVTLVGAGPGNPELMTLAAVRALRSADVIFYDGLVTPACLEFARREARRIEVGKRGRAPSCRQEDINAQVLEMALAGHNVVRLKSGDPMIFGRAGEELGALRRAGVQVTVVPGVTAAQACAASMQVSLTDRQWARRVQFVTGHARNGGLPEDIDWPSMADAGATTAIYMPLGTLRTFMQRLVENGVESTRPAAAIFSASRPEERIVAGTVSDLADRVTGCPGGGPDPAPDPCLVLVGNVVSEARIGAEAAQSQPPRGA